MLRAAPGFRALDHPPLFRTARQRDRAAAAALLGGAALWIALPFPLAGAGGLLFVLGAMLRLDWALLAVVVACPFYLPVDANPVPAKPVGSYRFSPAEVALVACVIAWAATSALRPARILERWREMGGALFPATLFVVAGVLSALAAVNRHEALRELRVVIVEPVLFGVMIMTSLDRRAVERLVIAGVALGVAVAAYAFYHYLAIGIVEATGGVRRVLAVYHSPNQLALLLDRLAPMAVALAVPRAGEPLRHWARRGVPALVAAGAMAGALVLTFSRGAWLAVAAATLALLAFRSWRLAVPAALGAVAGAVVVASVMAPGRLLSEHTSLQRPLLWGAAWRMALDHPLLGVGPDNFLSAYRDRGYMPAEGWREPNISHPHNLLLDAWLRTGVLGLAALTLALFGFWRGAARVLRFRAAPGWSSALALAGGMLAALLHGMIDNGYFLPDLAFLFWLAVGGMAVLAREQAAQEGRCGS
ncbi:MAG: O-antigen ligase family protein [Chloroflexota bacterium]|nr:O-antigen ligase family protein [Dehalococcoidia bacterium]MDW8253202.1 O-antigen ligase family protein [Chloroflexota bacterium]